MINTRMNQKRGLYVRINSFGQSVILQINLSTINEKRYKQIGMAYLSQGLRICKY